MWGAIKREWAGLQSCRDYFVHHAARYGWRPPQDCYQALVVLAMRIWEIHNRPTSTRNLFQESRESLARCTPEQANSWALRTVEALGAVSSYLALGAGYEPVSTGDLVASWMRNPWAFDSVASRSATDTSKCALFALAFMLEFHAPQQVEQMVNTFDECA